MSSISVSVATIPVALPQGITAGVLQINLCTADGGVVQSHNTDGNSISFSDIAPGSYYASVQRLDSSGNALGAPARSDTVVIASYEAPSVITISVA